MVTAQLAVFSIRAQHVSWAEAVAVAPIDPSAIVIRASRPEANRNNLRVMVAILQLYE
jgi:hypothetical protein